MRNRRTRSIVARIMLRRPRCRVLGIRGPRLRIGFVAFAAAAMFPAALTATNLVESSRADRHDGTAAANDVKPTDCSTPALSNVYSGDGTVSGGATNDLLLGGPSAQSLDGGGGDDCILGGAGDDQIVGGAGTDICIGGPGQDTFAADCEATVQGDATF